MFYDKYSVDDFQGLINLLENDAKEKLDSYIHDNRLFINGNESNVDIMLRFKSSNIFTIARIEVANKRIGIGSEVLHWCVQFAKKENFTHLRIECTHTEPIKSFCKKHNFKKEPEDLYIECWIKKNIIS